MTKKLTIHIRSFSYKKGLPKDRTGHGGGFIFDCRALPNPGRLDQYKALNGKDQAVKRYIEAQTGARDFFKHSLALISQAIKNYRSRGFTDLTVCYGCTGGQHRSVYFAEKLKAYLRRRSVKIDIKHLNL